MESFKPFLVDAGHDWCNGTTFAQICATANTYEGTIIRCFRRLDELLKQMIDAGKVIGNSSLEEKFMEASVSLKRGIVFAASLYV